MRWSGLTKPEFILPAVFPGDAASRGPGSCPPPGRGAIDVRPPRPRLSVPGTPIAKTSRLCYIGTRLCHAAAVMARGGTLLWNPAIAGARAGGRPRGAGCREPGGPT